mgnify:CR=1 FL=1
MADRDTGLLDFLLRQGRGHAHLEGRLRDVVAVLEGGVVGNRLALETGDQNAVGKSLLLSWSAYPIIIIEVKEGSIPRQCTRPAASPDPQQSISGH